ncbi:MAG TPA: M15 family metallopeptidase [Allosphingosinicella sp.]|nr:M15 family metallopeptidase [Allosphingosinicella sp.]
MNSESFRGKKFAVVDPDARLRKPDALGEYVVGDDGRPVLIPKGAKIRIGEVKAIPAGSEAVNVYVLALSEDGAAELGWTAAVNLRGKLLSETIGALPPPPGASRFGPNAAWSDGTYIGQVALVMLVGTDKEIRFISEATCDKFLAMAEAADGDGVSIGVNSGFRSWPEQKFLYEGRKKGLPGFAPANPPGYSKHQNGIAFDIDVNGGGSNPVYVWLAANATRFGFLRTVRSEPWHWEYLPEKAAAARARGVFSTFD